MFHVQKRFAGGGGNRIGLRRTQGCHFLNLVPDFIFEPRRAALHSWGGTANRSCIKTMLRWAVLGAILNRLAKVEALYNFVQNLVVSKIK